MCGINPVCTNISTDPAHCGNCAVACTLGDVCTTGKCSCPAGGTMCGVGILAVCADTADDPQNCGTCGTTCLATQACINSKCACRPGLTSCAGACVDELHDPANCGACGNACAFGQRCTDGVCGAGFVCGVNRTNCGGGCYTLAELSASPLHCSATRGLCGLPCADNQVCAQGICTNFFTSNACTASPCPACGTGTVSCTYPGTTEIICVQGAVCPQ
jgi:hypothetical protein